MPRRTSPAFGFRDVGLETDIANHPQMKAIAGADSVASDPDKTSYFRPLENPQIGVAKATLIQYFYYQDKAEGVLVVVSGAAEAADGAAGQVRGAYSVSCGQGEG